MDKEVEVRRMSTTAYKTFLFNNSPDFSIAKIRGEDIISLGIKLSRKLPQHYSGIDYPRKWKEGCFILFDFPFENPVYAELLECDTVYDLFEQIQGLYKDSYKHSKSSGINTRVKLKNLVLDRVTICKSGDVIVYV